MVPRNCLFSTKKQARVGIRPEHSNHKMIPGRKQITCVCFYIFQVMHQLVLETPPVPLLTLLEPQSRFGDKLLEIWVDCPQNEAAVLKGLTLLEPQSRFGDKLLIIRANCSHIWEYGSKRVKSCCGHSARVCFPFWPFWCKVSKKDCSKLPRPIAE